MKPAATVAVDKTGAAHSAGYLLIIPQKTAARVSPTVDTGMDGTYVQSPATVWSRARGRKSRPVRSGRRCQRLRRDDRNLGGTRNTNG